MTTSRGAGTRSGTGAAGRRAARCARALVWALGALVCGCRAPVSRDAVVDYADALFDVAPGRPLSKELRFYSCGDEAHLSRILVRPLTLETTAAGPGELILTACAGGETVQSAPSDARLIVTLSRPGEAPRELAYALGPDWREQRFDLGELGGGEVVAKLEKRSTHGAPVYVRDFALRSERPLQRARKAAPRAILISLDTFREDAVAAFGGGAVTPALDRLAGEAERFRPHWAAEISTKPSHASMLTGLPVRVHGCDRLAAPLAEGVETLAERLHAAGVATAGFANQEVALGAKYGFAQGFEVYRNERWSSAAELRTAAEWISSRGEAPFFAFVHLYAAHSDGAGLPYESPAMTPAEVERRFGVAGYGCRDGLCASGLLLALNTGARTTRLPREAEIVRALYDAGVESLDRDLARFFDDLRRAGLWDDTLIVVTADHGEAFDEHGYFLHTTAHEEVLRVPLLVKWPRGRNAGVTSDRPSTSLDLAPTLLAHFGAGAGDLTGADLSRPAPDAARPVARPIVSHQAVLSGGWKLLLETPEQEAALYDLAHDPGESSNRVGELAAEALRLRGLLDRFDEAARRLARAVPREGERPLDAGEIEQLRSLGYLP